MIIYNRLYYGYICRMPDKEKYSSVALDSLYMLNVVKALL
jgi:hypothetical protein